MVLVGHPDAPDALMAMPPVAKVLTVLVVETEKAGSASGGELRGASRYRAEPCGHSEPGRCLYLRLLPMRGYDRVCARRKVHASGRIMVAKQRIKPGPRHARKLVPVVKGTNLRVLGEIAVRPDVISPQLPDWTSPAPASRPKRRGRLCRWGVGVRGDRAQGRRHVAYAGGPTPHTVAIVRSREGRRHFVDSTGGRGTRCVSGPGGFKALSVQGMRPECWARGYQGDR